MKGLSPSQLEALAENISALSGAYLQKLNASDRDLVLGLWTKEGLRWLWIDMKVSEPYMALLEHLPAQELKQKPPLLNFVKAHAEGLPLVRVDVLLEQGRVLKLTFGDGKNSLELEARLIPHAPNIIAITREKKSNAAKPKQVSWNKIKELSGDFNREPTEHLSDEELSASVKKWLERFKKASAKAMTAEDIESRYKKEIEKRKKALDKVSEEIEKKQDPIWRQLGDWLKTHQNLKVPAEWSKLIDPKKSLAFNIEQSFSHAKENDLKLEGTFKRFNELKKELEKLQAMTPGQWFEQSTKKANSSFAKNQGKKIKTDFKARSLELSDEIKVYFGKSGADNLKLLRQARAWDYWVHLKDEPGSHGILFRPKNKEISTSHFRKIASKLVEYSLGEKAKARLGDRFQMLICEVRHVSPIKGDRLGRVNYHNEKVMGFVYESGT